ncbi:oplophorus-luciferin 2-monooxygenase non-catalytic subunit isoform X1 [Cherax quadricarinatus]|uniref:oplophorus-luciferin 2-monooxygenase non-catalytic subunit isoform X1 n=1 Tax=Cherax quadricarinatus TaxID=27406 RepID=UPI00387E8ABE
MALSVRRRVNTIGIELLRGAISPSSAQKGSAKISLLFQLSLLLLSVAATSSGAAFDFPGKVGAWPCPPEDELVPCTCYADDDLNLFLGCQELESISDLKAVFTASFQFKKFFRLQINDCNFTEGTLTKDIFEGFTFREVIMFNNKLNEVEVGIFSDSVQDLTFFEFSDPIPSFPLSNLESFKELRELVVDINCDQFPTLTSDSVLSFSLHCGGTNVTMETSQLNMNALTTLHLHDSNLISIGPENFESQSLNILTLNGNYLEEFDPEVLKFSSLLKLDLSDNLLTDMPFITGMAPKGTVRIADNKNLKQLSLDTTMPLLDADVTIHAEGVSLSCDCNLRWLLDTDGTDLLINKITVNVDCEHEEDFSDIRDILDKFC